MAQSLLLSNFWPSPTSNDSNFEVCLRLCIGIWKSWFNRPTSVAGKPDENAAASLPDSTEQGVTGDMAEGVIRRALVIGNGCAGAENQCIGLVRALGLAAHHCVTRPRGGINQLLNLLPISMHERLISKNRNQEQSRAIPLSADKSGLSDFLEADAKQIANMARATFENRGPLLVIASGKATMPVSSSIKRLAPENVFVVQIQHPRRHVERFDLVITPQHDYYPLTSEAQKQIPWFLQRWITPCEPPNKHVVLTVGALHRADSVALMSAASAWHQLSSLGKPLLVVNIGGPTSNCRYGVDLANELIAKLQNSLWSCGSVRISFSRRTPKEVSRIIMRELGGNPKICIWEGEGPNPHMGHLALADAFVVTADSVSMLSEVCTTGKPVYVVGADRCVWKFVDFQRILKDRGAVRDFTGKENISETWSYPPLNDTAEAAARVNEALAARGWRILP